MKRLLPLLASRYIAGTKRTEAVERALSLNRRGLLAAIDNLGENVKTIKEAQGSVDEYASLLEEILSSGARATVSLKLTHLGLDVSDTAAIANARKILSAAASLRNSVTFDMEGSVYTQRTIDIFVKLHREFPDTAIAIQSYLKRSAEDVRLLIREGASVRLVKGAYKEPPEIAFPDKKDVDANYESLMKELLLKGNRPAIATHDERLIEEAKALALRKGIPKEGFEFQMLLGIKRTLQERLAKEGYRVRIYVPYGQECLPYVMRRLRERKENVFFFLKNLFD